MQRLEKIEKILLYIFLFLIPFQIKDIWHWAGSEWNSVFFYLGDGLFILILIFWIIRKFQMPKSKFFQIKSKIQNLNLLLIAFLIIAGISLFSVSNLTIGIYRWIKLIEFGLLFFYLRSNVKFLKLKNIFIALIASGVVQSILAIAQFIKQSSLGLGILESGIFRPGLPGVATFSLGAEKIMRAYGSFQHSNILAGFLLLAIFCLYSLFLQREFKGLSKGVQGGILLVLIFALFLTFSRVALLVFLVMSLVMFLFFIIKRRWGRLSLPREAQPLTLFAVFLVSCIISIAILYPYLQARFFTISLEEEAIDLRFFYNKMAFAMIKEKPFLGIGIGNFVNYSQNYPAYLRAASKMLGSDDIPDWLYQPVHNIYLLIGAEIGVLGLILFLLFVGRILLKGILREFKGNSKGNFCLLFAVFGFLIIGLSDHYFWTLQSGALMFWIALALS